MIRDQLRTMIERVYLRDATSGVEEDHAVGSGGEVPGSWCQRIERGRLGRVKLIPQPGQRDCSKAAGGSM